MSKHLSWIIFALAFLLSFEASATRKVAVLMFPQDPKSHTSSAKFVEYLEDAVDQHRDCVLRRSADVLGETMPNSAITARKKIRSSLSKAKRMISEGELEGAEEELRNAMGEFSNAAAAMDRCGEICDTIIHLAGIEFLKGEEAAARTAISDVLAMDAGFKFDGATFDKSFMLIYRELKMKMETNGRLGILTVESTPPGARVYIDGTERGFSPLSLDSIPVGKHFVRIERAGYINYGAFIDVADTGATAVRPRLQPTEEFSEIADNVESLSKDIERRRGSRALSRIGAKLEVDRALLGTIRTEGNKVRLNLVIADFTEQAILSSASRTFQEDEHGEIAREVQRLGTKVINAANYASHNNEIKADSSDPLDHRTGMEDWGEEDRGRDQGDEFYQDPNIAREQRQQEQQKKKKKQKKQQQKKSSRYDDDDDRGSSSRSSRRSSDDDYDSSSSSTRSNNAADEPVESW